VGGGDRVNLLKTLAKRALTADAPYAALRARALRGHAVTLLTYHTIGADDEDFDAWTVLRRSDFLAQVERLRRDYDIVSLGDAFSDAPSARPRVVLTFDDGHSGWHEHLLPIALREALPVTLYVATGHVQSGVPYWFDAVVNALQTAEPLTLDARAAGLGRITLNAERGQANWLRISALLEAMKAQEPAARDALAERIVAATTACRRPPFHALRPLTVAQVRELAQSRWVTIGSHSHGHQLLDRIGLDAARDSIAQSMALLAEWGGRPVTHFAYPNGNYNAALAAALPALGLASAVTTKHGLWRRDGSRFELPRVAVGRFDDTARWRLNLLG
jgi:peptidoglycan/xylan/chitin deacetylase (PgdA/CDA1 family)